MKNILKDKYFSIQYFNDEGIEDVLEITKIDEEELQFEFNIGNFLISQNNNGRFYFHCECDNYDDEITFNEFKRLVGKAINND